MIILRSLKPFNNSKSIFFNVAWSVLGTFATLILGIVTSVILARWLGPASRGFYALIITTADNISEVMGKNSLASAYIFLTGKHSYSLSRLIGHIFWVLVINAIVMILLIVLLPEKLNLNIFKELNGNQVWLMVLITTSLTMSAIVTGILVGLDEIRLAVFLAVANQGILFALVVIFLVMLKMGISGGFWQLAFSALLSISMCFVIIGRRTRPNLTLSKEIIRRLVAFAAKIYPAYLGVILINQMDIYFVAFFSGAAAAGIYAVAKGLAVMVAIITPPIVQALTPKVVSGSEKDSAEILCQGFRFVFWFTSFLSIGFAFVASRLTPFLYGSQYRASALILVLLLPGQVFTTTYILYNYFTYQLGRPEISTFLTLSSGLIGLPIFYFFSRYFGASGTAIASSLVNILKGLAVIYAFSFLSKQPVEKLFFLTRDDLTAVSGNFQKIWAVMKSSKATENVD
jgi:O-antigen/teichoic acid export membrane protein